MFRTNGQVQCGEHTGRPPPRHPHHLQGEGSSRHQTNYSRYTQPHRILALKTLWTSGSLVYDDCLGSNPSCSLACLICSGETNLDSLMATLIMSIEEHQVHIDMEVKEEVGSPIQFDSSPLLSHFVLLLLLLFSPLSPLLLLLLFTPRCFSHHSVKG